MKNCVTISLFLGEISAIQLRGNNEIPSTQTLVQEPSWHGESSQLPYWHNQGIKPWWDNGNGAGTEKFDAYGHIAFWAKDEDDFNERARQPWISSANEADLEPNA